MRNNIETKNMLWNAVGTMFNAFNSLFFLIIVTRVNGVQESGIFSFSFSNACLLYIIGVYMGRTFQVSDTRKEITDTDYLTSRFISCTVMIIVAIIMVLQSDYSLYKIIIFMLLVIYKVTEAFSDVLYGVIQKNNELYKTGISVFAKSLIGIVFFVLVDKIFNNLVYACICIIIVNIVIMLIYDLPTLKKAGYKKEDIHIKRTIFLLKSGFYIAMTSFLSLYVMNASKYAIDGLLSDNQQAIFGIILMPATVIALAGQFIIQPFLLNMTKAYNGGNYNSYFATIKKMIILIVVFGLAAVIAAWFLGIPILQILYGISLEEQKIALLLIIIGASLYGVALMLSTALTIMRITFVQMIVYVFTAICAFFISAYLVDVAGVFGAALAYLIVMVVEVMIYVIVFLISVKNNKIMIKKEGQYD